MEGLMPGLTDDIARQCLLRVPFDAFRTVRSVCRLWKQELESPCFHRLRRSNGFSCPVVALAQAEPAFATGGPAQKYAASSTPSYRLVLFSPATGTWGSLPPIPSLPCGLPLFCQLAAVGRELLVVGGWDPTTWAASDGVYVYNFESGAWRRGARMPAPRRSFFACAASDSGRTVFVAGGHDEEKNALKSALVYDVASDAWAPLPDMSRERDECAGVFQRGRFQVIGGYATETQGQFGRSAEAFDSGTWSWGPVEEEALESATCPRRCAAGGDGRLYVCRAAGQVAVREVAEGVWRELTEVAEDARVAQQLVAWDRELMVMGSACHGGALACYISELNGMTTTWRKVEVPPEYSGHVQAGCCLEI